MAENDVQTGRTPRWVNVFAAIALVLLVAVVVMLVTGRGGGHGPGRHAPPGGGGGDTPGIERVAEDDADDLPRGSDGPDGPRTALRTRSLEHGVQQP